MTSLLTYFHTAPSFTPWYSHPHLQTRVLITAGIDGDEYAGIEAAKHLILTYQGNIPLTIIPIVNLAGYLAKTSFNPLDGKYPKYIYPGSKFGSSSSKLKYQLSQYERGIDLWIDLHGGASDEHLKPFIWASEVYPFLSHLSGRILVEKSIAKKVPYLILESGQLGETKPSAVKQHLSWINTILNNIDRPAKPNWHPTYTQIKFEKYRHQKNTSNTLWYSKKLFVTAS